ncbi:MAG: 16S rRNA (guanine(527)-N(7))-methyltransferase RsmG [Desulfuromonadaceae bacterium]|nr:16S rRNA (guanine(527)-N(7))-methyltransferase RsmG [Desulfuromonadaceae bacterium]
MKLERYLDAGLKQLEIELEPLRQARLLVFLDELMRWSGAINLTAMEDPLVALEKHLLDSVTLLPLLSGDESVLDFGSGAGLPGIPLKIARTEVEIWSLDAVRKKVNFQRHIVRQLALTGFHPQHARIEDFAMTDRGRSGFSLITARAVADLGKLVEWSGSLLTANGRLVAMKGPEGEHEVPGSAQTLKKYGLELVEVRRLRLPFSGSERQLLIFKNNG